MARFASRLILPFLSLLLALSAQPALARPPVWIIRDADSQIVLFGAVHVLPGQLDWRPPELDQALARADDLWFEIPMDPLSMASISRQAQSRGQLPRNQSLSAMLTPLDIGRLSRLEARLHLEPAALEQMEPWMAEVTLTLAAINRDGGAGSEGVESQLERSTPPIVKRHAFETSTQQLDFFHRAPMTAQLASLEDTLEELDQEPGNYRRLVDAWMNGDVAALNLYGNERLRAASPVLYKRLVTERNERWVKIIVRRLAGHGATVMVVGAGHLVGPDGVPARLRALGVSVDGP